MPPGAASAKSNAASRLLTHMEEFKAARVIMLYMSMSQEVDTSAIALAAWQDAKTVLVPKVNWEQRHMMAMEIHSLESGLTTSERGPVIREPQYGEPWPVNQIDFIVVPGLAFDRKGNRLGRGMGFYDRFLATPGMRAFTCGLAFGEQVVPEVPTAGHDQPINALVTDQEVLKFTQEPA